MRRIEIIIRYWFGVAIFLLSVVFTVILLIYLLQNNVSIYSLPSFPSKIIFIWLSGYIPLFTVLFVEEFLWSSIWLYCRNIGTTEHEDYANVGMLIFGWTVGIMMWVLAFCKFFERRKMIVDILGGE